MAIELTLDRAKELLAEAVALKGADYVYVNPDGVQASGSFPGDCHYVHGDQPGCIVGHVLHKAGVSLTLLSDQEGQNSYAVLRNLHRASQVSCEEGVEALLGEAQGAQDMAVPWGEAVRQAEEALEDA